MVDTWWGNTLIGLGAALLLSWLVLVIALLAVRPRGNLLSEALRILPDLLRLIPRLAADKSLPRGVRHAGLDAVRTHWPGTDDGFDALVRLTGLNR